MTFPKPLSPWHTLIGISLGFPHLSSGAKASARGSAATCPTLLLRVVTAATDR